MEEHSEKNGIINQSSLFSVAETLDRLESFFKSKGMTIFARIDQKAAAQKVGLDMRPTELLIFGDPRAGTLLMNEYPSLAIDLPLKALAWEDDKMQVWISYNSPAFYKERHQMREEPFQSIGGLITKALE
ncbi:MAG TPA: DUF302 domain-containing protein [Pyrinomonadaceae bacterium]|jgi:uncharacterized protein (DUF302 family)